MEGSDERLIIMNNPAAVCVGGWIAPGEMGRRIPGQGYRAQGFIQGGLKPQREMLTVQTEVSSSPAAQGNLREQNGNSGRPQVRVLLQAVPRSERETKPVPRGTEGSIPGPLDPND